MPLRRVDRCAAAGQLRELVIDGGLNHFLNLGLTYSHGQLSSSKEVIWREVGDGRVAPVHQDGEHAVGNKEKSDRGGQLNLVLAGLGRIHAVLALADVGGGLLLYGGEGIGLVGYELRLGAESGDGLDGERLQVRFDGGGEDGDVDVKHSRGLVGRVGGLDGEVDGD